MNISLIELLNMLLLTSGLSATIGVLYKKDILINVGVLILIISGLSLGYVYNIELENASSRFTQLDNDNMSDPDRLVFIHKICSDVFSQEECLNRLEKQAWGEP